MVKKSIQEELNELKDSENCENIEGEIFCDGNDELDSDVNVKWDGSESELIFESDAEDYEEKQTGAKIKYILSESEIKELFKHTRGYKNNLKLQKSHTVIQTVLFLVLLVLWVTVKNNFYGYLMLVPLICVSVIWLAPIFSIKKLAKELFSGEEIETIVYPDKICVCAGDRERQINLDSSAIYEEIGGMIVVYPKKDEDPVIIPIRAIEPDLASDVQAMIFAGATPKNETQ